MAKGMKTPGAPAAADTRGSNGRVTVGTAPMKVDDASAKIVKGQLRAKKGPTQDDASMGMNAHKARGATNASAQFRVSVSHRAPQPQQASGTLASGRIVPSVMGSKQAFLGGQRS